MDTANYNSINMSESLLSQPCHQLLMFSALLFSFFFNFSPSFLLFFLIPQYLFHIKLLLLINYQQVNTFILKFSPAFVTAHISRTNISCKIGKQVKPQVNLLLHRKNQDFIISFIRCPSYQIANSECIDIFFKGSQRKFVNNLQSCPKDI